MDADNKKSIDHFHLCLLLAWQPWMRWLWLHICCENGGGRKHIWDGGSKVSKVCVHPCPWLVAVAAPHCWCCLDGGTLYLYLCGSMLHSTCNTTFDTFIRIMSPSMSHCLTQMWILTKNWNILDPRVNKYLLSLPFIRLGNEIFKKRLTLKVSTSSLL